jgi:hypothetical protein
MMYPNTSDVKVIEIASGDGGYARHYALVLSYYPNDTTGYSNGLQVVKLDPYKTW